MKIPRPLLIILALVLIFVIILVISHFIKPKSQVGQINRPKPFNLAVVSSSLTDKPVGFTEPITIKFNKPIDEKSIQFKLKPASETVFSTNQTFTEVIISPKESWNFNTDYTLLILKTVRSRDGQTLGKDLEYKFKTFQYSGI